MKFFKNFNETLNEIMLKTRLKKIDVSTERKALSKKQEEELYGKCMHDLFYQLPDIVTDTYRYAVTYRINTFRETLTTTTSYFHFFKEETVQEWYIVELTMQGEPVSITFIPSDKKDRPIFVQNNSKIDTVRLFRQKDENLYSNLSKAINSPNFDANSKWLNEPVYVEVKEIKLNWDKIRYRYVAQNVVSFHITDRIQMILEVMVEHCLKQLKNEINRDMRSGKLMREFTNGEVKKNMIVAEEQEESVLPFI